MSQSQAGAAHLIWRQE